MTEPLEPTLAGECTFATNSAQCGSAEGDPLHVSTICGDMLDQAVKTLKKHPGAHIRLVGNRNSNEASGLANERAEAVALKLIGDYGIDTNLIKTEVGSSGNRTVKVYVEP